MVTHSSGCTGREALPAKLLQHLEVHVSELFLISRTLSTSLLKSHILHFPGHRRCSCLHLLFQEKGIIECRNQINFRIVNGCCPFQRTNFSDHLDVVAGKNTLSASNPPRPPICLVLCPLDNGDDVALLEA